MSQMTQEKKRIHVLVSGSAYASFADAVKGVPALALVSARPEEAAHTVGKESSFDKWSSSSSRGGLGSKSAPLKVLEPDAADARDPRAGTDASTETVSSPCLIVLFH